MSVARYGDVARALRVVACAPLFVACNAMLGITEPSDSVVDDVHSPITGSDAGRVARADAGSAAPDAGSASVASDAGVQLPASPFARANWPMPNAADAGLSHPQAFEAVVDGVVKDTTTGLEWQVVADTEPRDFAGAAAYCDGLDLAGGGFRVPSRIELTSLIDLSQASPALDDKVFPAAEADRYWTSSGYAGGADRAWLVSFSFSTSHVISDLASELHLTRCVRRSAGSIDTPPPNLVVAADTVTDPATGLEWQRAAGSQKVAIEDAQAACARAAMADAGFRLPSLKELHTLVAESGVKPAIDATAFPACPSDAFWTQSHVPNFGEYTWTVSFVDGSDVWVAAEATAYVRCVREVPSP